jgi:sugar-specific transcriptional regulator TrmB
MFQMTFLIAEVETAVFEEKEQVLELLGLSPTQAHVYLTLIKSRKTSAKTLAKQTGVACPDIYRIMNIFEKMGLIQKIIEYPKKYEAIKIEKAIPSLINRKKEEIKEERKKILEFIKEMKSEQNNFTDPEIDSDLVLLPATKGIIEKRKAGIRNAEYSIDSVISWKCHKSLLKANFKGVIKKAITKGVKFRIIIENPKKANLLENQVLKLINKNVAIRYTTTSPPALITIYDKKEAEIYTSNKAGLCDASLLWSNNSSVVSVASGYFEYIWAQTEKVVDGDSTVSEKM